MRRAAYTLLSFVLVQPAVKYEVAGVLEAAIALNVAVSRESHSALTRMVSTTRSTVFGCPHANKSIEGLK